MTRSRTRPKLFLAAALAVSLASAFPSTAQAKPAIKRTRETPATLGLGRNCHKDADCKHPSQRCQKEADVNGKVLPFGFCILPCTVIDELAGKKVHFGPVDATTENVQTAKKAPPPRCPRDYQCRSAGQGVAIDTCVKE
jgi:hypothetical protein